MKSTLVMSMALGLAAAHFETFPKIPVADEDCECDYSDLCIKAVVQLADIARVSLCASATIGVCDLNLVLGCGSTKDVLNACGCYEESKTSTISVSASSTGTESASSTG
ncbi:hypothetical protein FZEAL_5911, partial [Fusarium zealandicum]